MSPSIRCFIVPVSEVPAEDVRVGGMQQRVLVVDDDRLVAQTLTLIFRHGGFDAGMAFDAETALKLAAVQAPDILVTDMNMPGVNGVDLALSLRQLIPNCPVLLFSSDAPRAELLRARAAGHDLPLLMKPVHPSVLLETVRACLVDADAARVAAAGAPIAPVLPKLEAWAGLVQQLQIA